VSRKSARVAGVVEQFGDEPLDPHYLGYFDCFNRQHFFEAHDVLEELWLKERQGPNGAFYKGLIQLAGAFVHLQKNRPRPAAALFKLALGNLEKYPRKHEQLDTGAVCALAQKWLGKLESPSGGTNPLADGPAPELALELPHPRD
jgi:predicted metal-dependent hydrolase